jgi:hypothetical protein
MCNRPPWLRYDASNPTCKTRRPFLSGNGGDGARRSARSSAYQTARGLVGAPGVDLCHSGAKASPGGARLRLCLTASQRAREVFAPARPATRVLNIAPSRCACAALCLLF